MPNYYGTSFPYQAFGVGDGTWSNSDPMTFLGGYGGQISHDSYGLFLLFFIIVIIKQTDYTKYIILFGLVYIFLIFLLLSRLKV